MARCEAQGRLAPGIEAGSWPGAWDSRQLPIGKLLLLCVDLGHNLVTAGASVFGEAERGVGQQNYPSLLACH